ncbi:MAG: flagellar basal body L-ring protein FlgH [Halieaceae bacterium]|nr:flagellar basal body L-ring protein FlgH [Halieaceae bacterium]
MIFSKGLSAAAVLLSAALATGCASPQVGPPPEYVPPYNLSQVPPKPLDGRIFQDGRELSLFQDVKARQVGDILTVVLAEQTRGTKSADTAIDKSTSNDISVPEVGGERFGKLGANLSSESSFSGEGSSAQSNSLDGRITVVVTEVLPSGNLVVQGEKWIKINQGDEYVRLSGLVRPEDIDTFNTVPSTQVADARISYGANGAVSEANSVGWLSRFFMSPIWPF